MRLTSRRFFDSLVKNPNQFFIIHYSSQSLYDPHSGRMLPRITSIAALYFGTGQTTSFPVHAQADPMHCRRCSSTPSFRAGQMRTSEAAASANSDSWISVGRAKVEGSVGEARGRSTGGRGLFARLGMLSRKV